jgi:hypothetical protein
MGVVFNPLFRQQFNCYVVSKNAIPTLDLGISSFRNDLPQLHSGLTRLTKRDLRVISDANLVLALIWLSVSEIPGLGSRWLNPKGEAAMVGNLLAPD